MQERSHHEEGEHYYGEHVYKLIAKEVFNVLHCKEVPTDDGGEGGKEEAQSHEPRSCFAHAFDECVLGKNDAGCRAVKGVCYQDDDGGCG